MMDKRRLMKYKKRLVDEIVWFYMVGAWHVVMYPSGRTNPPSTLTREGEEGGEGGGGGGGGGTNTIKQRVCE